MNDVLLGFIVSIIYSVCLLPKKEGKEPYICPTFYPIIHKGMIIIPYSSEKALHIHHWIIFLLVCISSIYLPIPKFIYGFSFGLCIQGLLYSDWYQIICNNPYN